VHRAAQRRQRAEHAGQLRRLQQVVGELDHGAPAARLLMKRNNKAKTMS
jgi:hypothetical protein